MLKSPIAAISYAVLDEASRLNRRLKFLILLNRALLLLAVGAVISAIVWSYWLFFLAVGLVASWYLVTNRRQTATNVDLCATIMVCQEMLLTDTDFRSSAVNLLRVRRGPEVADAWGSLLEDLARAWDPDCPTSDET